MSGVWTEKVKLTADQRILIIGTMHEFRDKKLHDLDVQNSIIMRIEGALTKLRNTQHSADPQASLYRLEQFVEAKSDADRQKHCADSTRQCNFTYDMKREAAMPKCFSPSKVKEHECEPTTASLRVSVTKFMH